jgi:hypothetical protein
MTLPGETEAGTCRDATMLRDNPEGSSSRSSAAREGRSPALHAEGAGHRTIFPHALKIPAPQGRNLH